MSWNSSWKQHTQTLTWPVNNMEKRGNFLRCNKHIDFNRSKTHMHKVKSFLEENKMQRTSTNCPTDFIKKMSELSMLSRCAGRCLFYTMENASASVLAASREIKGRGRKEGERETHCKSKTTLHHFHWHPGEFC